MIVAKQTKLRALVDLTAEHLGLEDHGWPADVVVFNKGELIERDGWPDQAGYISVKVEQWGWADVHKSFVERVPIWQEEA